MKKISMKDLMRKYKHSWVLLYFLVYMVWFMYLEKRPYVKHYLIYTKFDDCVPFNEYFVIPYLIWFGYIVVVMGYFFFTNEFLSLHLHLHSKRTAFKTGSICP